MIVLAGDIGGTKTILRVCNIENNGSNIINEQTFSSGHYSSFYELLDLFLSSSDTPSNQLVSACFAVAGPIVNGSSKITNLPWTIDESTLAEKYNFSLSKIINDFTAIGFGLSQLNNSDITVLRSGVPNSVGTKTILGAGTGLGMCMVIPRNGEPVVLPSEIGNTDFAPGNEFSVELTAHMLKYKKRIMYEDILSGAGLENIYTFLEQKFDTNNIASRHLNTKSDSALAARISQSALSGGDYIAKQALDYFTKIYAVTASNVALTTLSLGGLYIAGGIAPKIFTKLNTATFTEAFLDNKKMHHILSIIPIYIIVNPKVGLLGAIEFAKHAYTH